MATPQDAQNQVNALKKSQKYRKRFDFVREFVIKAGKADSEAISMPSEGPFEQAGYNIIHSLQLNGKAPYKLRFRSAADNASQSNDFIPAALIATPGAPAFARYGYREFWHLYSANDTLTIDWDGRAMPEDQGDITVAIVFTGWLYPGSK